MVDRPLPLYECHKHVRALKIREVLTDSQGRRGSLVFEDDTYPALLVSGEYLRKHEPQPGGYYVLYEDGYQSFSPAEAFESGYHRI